MSDILRYVMETGLCLVIFYAAYWLFLRRETFFLLNRLYLVGSLLLSFAIPAFKIASPFLTAPVPAGPIDLPSLASLRAPSLNITDVLAAVYAAGALLFLVRFALHLSRLARVVRKNGASVHDGFKIVTVDKDFAPFSFFHYIFINPQGFSPDNLRHILAHEQAHVRQGHSWDVLLAEGVSILQWFNPIVRPYKKSIKETHEFLADGEVIAQGFNSARYRLLMLEQQVGSPLSELSNNFRQSQIKRRIVMISQKKSKGAARLKALLLMPLAVLLVLALAQPRPVATAAPGLAAGPQDTAAQSQEEMNKQKRIVKAAENLAVLKDKEAKLRQALDSTTDPEKQKDLEKSLQIILEMQKNTETFLKNPDTVPPPPPLPPPAPGKADLKMLREKEAAVRKQLASENDPGKQQELKESLEKILIKQKDLELCLEKNGAGTPPTPSMEMSDELAKIKLKIAYLETTLASTSDTGKQKELKATLEKVHQKQKDVEAYFEHGAGAPPPPPPPDRKAWLNELMAKTEQVRMEMDKTQDPAKKAELEAMLKKLEAKQADIRADRNIDAAPDKLTADDLAKMLVSLQEKETEVRAMLEKTQVREKVAELNDILKKIELKRADLKAKIAEAKKAPQEIKQS
jgi:hypothetical protein